MTGKVLSSEDEKVCSWREAESFGPIYGAKGSRLLAIPRKWTPPFGLLSVEVSRRLVTGEPELLAEIWPSVEKMAIPTGAIILRSSVVGETIWDRGTYHSEKLTLSGLTENNKTLFLETLRKVQQSAQGRPCGIIVHSFVEPDEAGEFGNLQRVSKTRDHWELGVRSGELVQTDRYNSQRDTAPAISEPLTAKAGRSRERLFGSISAWINNELLRGVRTRVSCEWVRTGEAFYVVQVDAEDDDISGVNPMQLYIEPTIEVAPKNGKLLRVADQVARKAWDKLGVLNELFFEADQYVPTLYYVPLADLIQPNSHELLQGDFSEILKKNIVVRTSVAAGTEKITNLPKTDCLTPASAAKWCMDTAFDLREKYGDREFAFIAHRYIAARASAWARADYRSPVVEVHGTWGLPDALQFCPYDIWDVHVPTDEITEYPSYKSNVLLLQDDGSWKYERVRNEVARFQSISRTEVFDIARRSLQISERLGSACHVMWFVGCRTDDGRVLNIPWYWTGAHSTEPHERTRSITFAVRTRADIARIAELRKREPKLAVGLLPDTVELLRDNVFLGEVAQATVPLGVPIVLSGSTLAHAYYQLRKHGCVVIPEGDKDHLRVRRQANFGKLVRDKIPAKIASQREQQSIATIPKSGRIGFLIGKFLEELLEAREAGDRSDLTTELADVFEVLRAMISSYEIDFDAVALEAERKRKKVGGFDEGRLLIGTSLPKPTDSELLREETISPEVFGEYTRAGTYRVPFAFFGFSEIGQSRTIAFAREHVSVQITLQRDGIEIGVIPDPKQLDLDFTP
ncbi:nucleoside triphosphate pyrophosphohydrolase [Mesorhizobium sp. VK24D]|uniref:Nucleoside triphosphate pyrophosphohydrolase n=1 Tax=Mesorhizobium album TaxID=3072314 RepID=A0ABU4XQK3_9HYPH|nr:nucleoside triphosphate pyrophosphohydrolase [Mesorhizobium sp. VK24D]MDX8477011.1 nucleoside triphosphate pyrophosphohydrolase [Mesorhizobium sp. VK24D]